MAINNSDPNQYLNPDVRNLVTTESQVRYLSEQLKRNQMAKRTSNMMTWNQVMEDINKNKSIESVESRSTKGILSSAMTINPEQFETISNINALLSGFIGSIVTTRKWARKKRAIRTSIVESGPDVLSRLDLQLEYLKRIEENTRNAAISTIQPALENFNAAVDAFNRSVSGNLVWNLSRSLRESMTQLFFGRKRVEQFGGGLIPKQYRYGAGILETWLIMAFGAHNPIVRALTGVGRLERLLRQRPRSLTQELYDVFMNIPTFLGNLGDGISSTVMSSSNTMTEKITGGLTTLKHTMEGIANQLLILMNKNLIPKIDSIYSNMIGIANQTLTLLRQGVVNNIRRLETILIDTLTNVNMFRRDVILGNKDVMKGFVDVLDSILDFRIEVTDYSLDLLSVSNKILESIKSIGSPSRDSIEKIITTISSTLISLKQSFTRNIGLVKNRLKDINTSITNISFENLGMGAISTAIDTFKASFETNVSNIITILGEIKEGIVFDKNQPQDMEVLRAAALTSKNLWSQQGDPGSILDLKKFLEKQLEDFYNLHYTFITKYFEECCIGRHIEKIGAEFGKYIKELIKSEKKVTWSKSEAGFVTLEGLLGLFGTLTSAVGKTGKRIPTWIGSGLKRLVTFKKQNAVKHSTSGSGAQPAQQQAIANLEYKLVSEMIKQTTTNINDSYKVTALNSPLLSKYGPLAWLLNPAVFTTTAFVGSQLFSRVNVGKGMTLSDLFSSDEKRNVILKSLKDSKNIFAQLAGVIAESALKVKDMAMSALTTFMAFRGYKAFSGLASNGTKIVSTFVASQGVGGFLRAMGGGGIIRGLGSLVLKGGAAALGYVGLAISVIQLLKFVVDNRKILWGIAKEVLKVTGRTALSLVKSLFGWIGSWFTRKDKKRDTVMTKATTELLNKITKTSGDTISDNIKNINKDHKNEQKLTSHATELITTTLDTAKEALKKSKAWGNNIATLIGKGMTDIFKDAFTTIAEASEIDRTGMRQYMKEYFSGPEGMVRGAGLALLSMFGGITEMIQSPQEIMAETMQKFMDLYSNSIGENGIFGYIEKHTKETAKNTQETAENTKPKEKVIKDFNESLDKLDEAISKSPSIARNASIVKQVNEVKNKAKEVISTGTEKNAINTILNQGNIKAGYIRFKMNQVGANPVLSAGYAADIAAKGKIPPGIQSMIYAEDMLEALRTNKDLSTKYSSLLADAISRYAVFYSIYGTRSNKIYNPMVVIDRLGKSGDNNLLQGILRLFLYSNRYEDLTKKPFGISLGNMKKIQSATSVSGLKQISKSIQGQLKLLSQSYAFFAPNPNEYLNASPMDRFQLFNIYQQKLPNILNNVPYIAGKEDDEIVSNFKHVIAKIIDRAGINILKQDELSKTIKETSKQEIEEIKASTRYKAEPELEGGLLSKDNIVTNLIKSNAAMIQGFNDSELKLLSPTTGPNEIKFALETWNALKKAGVLNSYLRHTLKPGQYVVVINDNNNQMVHQYSVNIDGGDVSINSNSSVDNSKNTGTFEYRYINNSMAGE